MNDSNSKKTFVKICGITSLEDALTAVEFGSDALGFNFVSSSKRKVTAELVKSIVEELPKEIMTVGVFQDFKIEELLKLIEDIGLNAAQMHGSESFEECQFIAERVPVTIKALNPNSPELSNFLDFGVDYLLLDSLTPGEGKRFNWEVDTDFLFKDAMATDALSIILFITISIECLFNLALSLAISASFHASCFFFERLIF